MISQYIYLSSCTTTCKFLLLSASCRMQLSSVIPPTAAVAVFASLWHLIVNNDDAVIPNALAMST